MSDSQPAALLFEPTERQTLYHDAMLIDDRAEVGFGGGRYGGKSYAIAWVAFELSVLFPGTRGAIFRQDSVDLERSTMQSFKDWMALYQPAVKIKWRMSSPISCDIDAGGKRPSRIYWMDTKTPADTQSLNLHWAQIDEASEVTETFFLMLEAAVGRCVLPDGRRPEGKIGWGSNPGPGWCKNKFPVGTRPGRRKVTLQLKDGRGKDAEKHLWRFFIPAWVKDNKFADPQFEAFIRATYPETWVRRWLEGDWDAFEGQVFDEFDEADHVFNYKFITTSLTNLICMDWGFRSVTSCLLVSIDGEGCFWVSREYRASGRSPEQHKPHIQLLAEGVEVRRWIMDYAATDQSDGTPLSRQFRDIGLPFHSCGKKNKNGPDGAIIFLKQLMHRKLFKVHESCAGLIKEIKEAMWEPQATGQVDKKSPKERMVDANDHSIDALFMALDWYRQRPVEQTAESADRSDRAQIIKRRIEEAKNEIILPNEYGEIGKRKKSSWAM